MSKHSGFTPGPWRTSHGVVLVGPGGGTTIARAYDRGDKKGEEHLANARLIAAAPDLLAENERLRELLERAANALDPIRHPTMTAEDELVENDIARTLGREGA